MTIRKLILLAMLASVIVPVALADNSLYGYQIGDVAIIDYSNGIITLADNRTILVDGANTSLYMSRITYNKSYSSRIISTNTGNYALSTEKVPEGTVFPEWQPDNATRITQGDYVWLGETVDISGMGWYTGYIEYAGPYYDDLNAYGADNITAEYHKVEARNLSAYYIDPAYFSGKLGWWYIAYTGNGDSGNDRLFFVGVNPPLPVVNVPKTMAESNESEERAYIANRTRIPVKTISGIDLILSRNVSTTMDCPESARSWLFGINSPDIYYDVPTIANQITYDAEDTFNLPAGRYSTIFITPDPSGLYEQTYNRTSKSIISPFRNISDIYIGDLQSYVAEMRLTDAVYASLHSNLTRWRVDLQDPSIQVMKIDQITLRNNTTMFAIAGYTNMNQGDVLTIALDQNLTGANAKTHKAVVVNNGGQVAYRAWNSTFITNFNDAFPGMHFLTVTSNEGAAAIVPFYIRRELPPMYQPDTYLQFVDNSPFIPPVIQTVTVTVPVTVIQTVVIHDTPSQESVDAAQAAAINAIAWGIGEAVIAMIIGFFVVRYLYGVWKRRRWMKE